MAAAVVPSDARERDKLEKAAETRLNDCRAQKRMRDRDIREAYFFTDPQRYSSISSATAPTTNSAPQTDASELQTSLGMECAEDFTTEVMNAFMPQTAPWAAREKGPLVPDDVWDDVKEKVAEDDATIFSAIKASNLYEAAAQGFSPDLSIGTAGLWIDNLRPAEPIVCQSVPIREMEINVGPTGTIDDRWIIRHTRLRMIAALMPGVRVPEEIAARVEREPEAPVELRWGFWRDWNDRSDIVWIFVNMIAGKLVKTGKLRGAGSCPFIPMRFNPDPMYAFGRGSAIRALPELRKLDEVDGLYTENLDHAIRPPFLYPDDSMINFGNGIEAGMGYPARMGPGSEIHPLYFQGDKQFSEFAREETERRIRRLFFIDRPEQRGDTPPTATQWLDEMMLAQRRIGTPGMSFWREGPGEIFLRFQYLLEKRGVLKPIKVDGKSVALQAVNPAERAADQQKFMASVRLLQTAAGIFPTETQATVDGTATIQKWKDVLGDTLVQFRDPKEVQGLLQTFANAQPQGAGTLPTGGAGG